MSLPDRAAGGLSYIEQVVAAGCSRPNRPYMIAANKGAQTAVIFKPRCKCWSCPECALTNQRLWEFKIIHGAKELMERGEKLSMVTITNLGKMTAGSSLFKLPAQWNKLFHRARRKAGNYQYVCLPERTQRRIVHLHLLATFDLGTRWWKDNGAKSGFGYQNQESELTNCFRAGWYAAKYLSKSAAATLWPTYFHRVRVSRGWPRLPELEKPAGWEFVHCADGQRVDALIPGLQKEGFGVALADHRSAWAVVHGDTSAYDQGVLWA